MGTEESVKCSESRGIKYLTVREQEDPWDRIFYYCIKAELQHVLRYKGHTHTEDISLHIICHIVAGFSSNLVFLLSSSFPFHRLYPLLSGS